MGGQQGGAVVLSGARLRRLISLPKVKRIKLEGVTQRRDLASFLFRKTPLAAA